MFLIEEEVMAKLKEESSLSVNYAINLVILFIVASIGIIQISMGICLLMDLLLVF